MLGGWTVGRLDVFAVSWYNDGVGAEHRIAVPADMGHATALLVGNSSSLWPDLCAGFQGRDSSMRVTEAWMEARMRGCEVEREGALAESGNVVDVFTEQAVTLAAALAAHDCSGEWPAWGAGVDFRESGRLAASCGSKKGRWVSIHFSHDTRPGRLVGMVRCAGATGQLHVCPEHLAVHPEFGPWIALRAVVVFDDPFPSPSLRPPPLAAPFGAEGRASMADAFRQALTNSGNWKAWLAVRDACPLNAHRYPEDMILYHYACIRPHADTE